MSEISNRKLEVIPLLVCHSESKELATGTEESYVSTAVEVEATSTFAAAKA